VNTNAITGDTLFIFPRLKRSRRFVVMNVAALGGALAVITSSAALDVPSLLVVDVSVLTLILFLLLFSFLMARYTRAESTLSHQLALTDAVNHLFSECEDRHRTLAAFTNLLRASQGAAKCILALNDSERTSWVFYEADDDTTTAQVRKIEKRHGDPADEVYSADDVLVYGRTNWWSAKRNCFTYSADSLQRGAADDQVCESLAQVLGTDSFISLPLRTRRDTLGRLHLGFNHGTRTRNDVRLRLQVLTQAALMIECMQATSPGAPVTTIDERKRISRDLHDSTIQPYVGLKLGLEALRRKCGPNDELAHDIDELLQMTADNIGELRSYVGRLKSDSPRQRKISLVPSIRSQAQRFSDYHDINVQVVSHEDILVSRALFDEIMHITRESLYNVRRHTTSKNVTIALSIVDRQLLLEVTNHDHAHRTELPTFRPRSISDRASELGGHVTVEERQVGCTAVSIRIPL